MSHPPAQPLQQYGQQLCAAMSQSRQLPHCPLDKCPQLLAHLQQQQQQPSFQSMHLCRGSSGTEEQTGEHKAPGGEALRQLSGAEDVKPKPVCCLPHKT